jgi:hypothetical protein
MDDLNKKKHEYKKIIKKPKLDKQLLKAVWSPTLKNWKDIIEDFIEISKKRKDNKLAMFYLQMNILNDVLTSHSAIKEFNELLKNPLKAREYIPAPEPIDDFHINHWKTQLEIYEILSKALVDIGDGILWRMLNFDRSLLYMFSINPDSGLKTLNSGMMAELIAFMDIVNEQDVDKFIFHAITNTGRIADLTYLENNKNISFVEVKSGKNTRGTRWKERIERQIEKGNNLTKFANEGIGNIGKEEVKVINIEGEPELLMMNLEAIVTEAKKQGITNKVLNDFLGIVVIDQSLNIDEVTFKKSFEELYKEIGDYKSCLEFEALDYFEFTPHRVPFSVYPMKSEYIAEILLGKILIYYIFNIGRFENMFGKYGWSVKDSIFKNKDFKDKEKFFCEIIRDKITVKLPFSVLTRLIYEGLSFGSLISIINAIKDKGEFKGILFNFDGEKNVWR